METVVFTGANRGIGLELARVFLAHNYFVIGSCRQPDVAIELKKLSNRKNLEILVLDVSKHDSRDFLCTWEIIGR